MNLLLVVFRIIIIMCVLGFFPALLLILELWRQTDKTRLGVYTLEWFPVVVYSWLVAIGLFFGLTVYFIYFAR